MSIKDIREKILGPSQKEIWSKFAEEIEAHFDNGSIFETKKIISKFDKWVITIDTYTKSLGKINTTYTRFTAPFKNFEEFDFEVYRRNKLNNVEIALGMQDIDLGYGDFDENFIIKGNDEYKIKELFSSRKIRELISNQTNIRLKVEEKGWFSDLPDGVYHLYLDTNAVIKDINELEELYLLFILVLNKLSLMEPDSDLEV